MVMPPLTNCLALSIPLLMASGAGGTAPAQRVEPPLAEEVRPALEDDLVDLLRQFQEWDFTCKDGRGNSMVSTSGGLGWRQSTFLQKYVYCFQLTHDPYWPGDKGRFELGAYAFFVGKRQR